MQFTNQRKIADAVVLPFWETNKGAEEACPLKEFASLIQLPVKAKDFKGKEGETLLLYRPSHKGEKRVLLLGLGAKKEAREEGVRRAYGVVTKFALQKKYKSLNLFLPEKEVSLTALCEGLLLANYAFDQFKEKPAALIEKITFIDLDKKGLQECKRVLTVVSAVNMARDLVNGNADDVTPQTLVAKAKELAKEFSSLKVTALDKKQIEKEKMGLLLAVNRGSTSDPALIILEYRGDPDSAASTAIVGKGITYDTGGLNIKQTGHMETMKSDMAGAAAVLGTMQALAALEVKANVIGIIASTENAIGPNSYKPGDIYRSHAGKSVEISNTDAEGRLVLADALSYVQTKHKPTQIIDLATLTGGIVIALGEEATGLFSNNDRLANALFAAGEKTYERVWRFPLYPEYKEALKSPIADMKNSGGRKASSITAALFLQEFIKDDLPWAHLDIAGTAYLSDHKPYQPTAATGVGVRLLLQFLEHSD